MNIDFTDQKLTNGVKYYLFIRAWYSANTYAVFRSDGVTPDVTPPKISTIRGTKVGGLGILIELSLSQTASYLGVRLEFFFTLRFCLRIEKS